MTRHCCFANEILTVNDASDFKSIIENSEGKIARIMPKQYIVEVDCKNDPIEIPDNSIITAYGAELIFRFTNPDGYWAHQCILMNAIKSKIFGGKWWIDRANSVEQDARRLFQLKNNSEVFFKDVQIDNGSGREGIQCDNSRIIVKDSFFKALQNLYTSNNYIRIGTESEAVIDSCEFDGFYEGQETLRTYVAVEYSFRGFHPFIVRNSRFRHMKGAIFLRHDNYECHSGHAHISNNEFMDFNCTATDTPIIGFRINGASSAGYNIKEITIENCKFRGGGTQTGQIGVYRSDTGHTGIQRLILRNLSMFAEGKYTKAKYAIDFPEAGSGDSILKIAEMSDIFCSTGYGSQAININGSIPIGKYDVTLES